MVQFVPELCYHNNFLNKYTPPHPYERQCYDLFKNDVFSENKNFGIYKGRDPKIENQSETGALFIVPFRSLLISVKDPLYEYL